MPRRSENIYKRKDGRWEGRFKSGYNADGKARYRSVYGKTYTEVRIKLSSLKAESKQYGAVCRLTVKELFEEWMSAISFKVKKSTYANYRMKADVHILPVFGKVQYEKLTAKMLHDFIAQKLRSGLSAKYVSDIVIVLKSMAKYTSRLRNLRNPFDGVILPKSNTKKEPQLFSEVQQERLVRHLIHNQDSTKLCILLSFYTGLRIGELCALRWSDIDFEKNILTVRRTVQRIRTGNSTKLHVDVPKSRSSQRSIPIPDFLMKQLRKFRSSGECYILSGSIKVTDPRTMQYRFKAILRKAGLPSINFHALRHMFATNCIRLGFDVKTLSELLGHSSVETTLNRYVHSSMERKIECMGMLKAFQPSEILSG